jgi:hypothetical protein
MVGLIKDVGGWFNTYRYKFHVSILKLAKEFKLINNNVTEYEEYDELLKEFITEDVWKNILQMHLKATDQQRLRKNKEIGSKLGILVCQTVKAVLIAQQNGQDTQSVIKKFDKYTLDLEIPTKLNIAGSLAVRELLDL